MIQKEKGNIKMTNVKGNESYGGCEEEAFGRHAAL
jgi:hypothetical protein